MLAHIYIHSNGVIVQHRDIEIEHIEDLNFLFEEANEMYGHFDGYCFDVMILGRG